MNTYRIYEDLRSSLGEEAAKSLAHTLSPMFEELRDTVTKTEFRELNATVGRLAEAQERTEDRVAQLAVAQERTEDRVAQLAVAQERTEDRVAQLAAAQERTEDRVTQLAAAQERTEDRVTQLAAAQERTEDRVAQLAAAQERTEDRVAQLAAAQERTEDRVAQLAAAQERTEERVTELTKAQVRTESAVVELTKAQARTESAVVELKESQVCFESEMVRLTQAQALTEARMTELTGVVQSLVFKGDRQASRLDAVLGRTFEMQFRDRLTSYLGRLMRRGKLLRNDEVLDVIEQSVDSDEADEVLRADAIATGLIDGVTSHVVVEVSVTCDTEDIDRAAGRAGILRKAGLAAVPLVACEVISRESFAYACSRQVRIWCNGTMLDAAA